MTRALPPDLAPVWRGVEQVRAQKLAEGFWCLRLPVPYTAMPSVNAYLLALRDGGYCLVDCGSGLAPGREALERGLALAGARVGELRRLVATHLHADHAGLGPALVAETGCEFLHALGPHTVDDVLRDPVTPLAERRARAIGEGVPADEIDLWVDAHLADDVHHERIAPSRWLAAGDVLSTRVGEWVVVPAGGHSATQVALVEARGRWAITADLAYDIPESFLEYGWTLDPYAEQLASLARVAALAPAVVLPGHGRPDERPAERFAAARSHAEALAERFVSAVRERPRSAYEVVAAMVPDAAEYNRRQSLLSIGLCVFEHFAARGVVAATVGDDGVRRFAASR